MVMPQAGPRVTTDSFSKKVEEHKKRFGSRPVREDTVGQKFLTDVPYDTNIKTAIPDPVDWGERGRRLLDIGKTAWMQIADPEGRQLERR